MIVGAGGALLLLLAFQVFRAARHDVSESPVSQTWLSEQKRAKSDDGSRQQQRAAGRPSG